MRKFLAIILLIFSSIFASAQNQTSLIPDESWKTYKGNFNELLADFPAKPKSVNITQKNEILGRVYRAYHDKTFYLIVSCENKTFLLNKSFASKECPQLSSLADLITLARNSKESEFKESEFMNGTLSVKQFTFLDSEGFYQVVQQFRTINYTFVLHALSEYKDNPNVEKFIKSFQLGGENTVGATIEKETISINSYDTSNLLAFREIKPAQSTSPVNTSNTVQPANSNDSYTSLKITYKVSALYTELARLYEISGNVRLYVTFHDNGKIGNIVPSIKLPFGLTNSAINAARLIRFEPAGRNGKPITLTKTVEYNFILY